jgi:two-component system cell cycle response regulator DivK
MSNGDIDKIRPSRNLYVDECPPARIMIVEDNEWSMRLLNAILEAHGYSIVQSWSGESAFRIARQELPDLILMDICLPGVSGLEVIKFFKEDEDLKKIPIIAVTALAMPGDEEKIRRGGADGYMSKPISMAGLVLAIGNLLKGSISRGPKGDLPIFA